MSGSQMLGRIVLHQGIFLRNKLTLEKLLLEFMHAAFLFTKFLLPSSLFCCTHFVNDRNQIANE